MHKSFTLTHRPNRIIFKFLQLRPIFDNDSAEIEVLGELFEFKSNFTKFLQMISWLMPLSDKVKHSLSSKIRICSFKNCLFKGN